MIYISIIIIISLIAICSILFSCGKKEKNNNIINSKNLFEYINQNIKKRKTNYEKLKNNTILYKNNKISAKIQKDNYITYKRIPKTNIGKTLKKFFIQNNKTYVEFENGKYSKQLIKLAVPVENFINKNKNTYRAINNECIVETVANSYAHAILIEDKFNIFENFSNLTKLIKVYKKEAEILNHLVILKLLELYTLLQKDIYYIKKDIFKGAKAKKINSITPAFIYGVYLFNPASTKLLLNKFELVKNCTTRLIEELDNISYKQKIIYKYTRFLSNGIA